MPKARRRVSGGLGAGIGAAGARKSRLNRARRTVRAAGMASRLKPPPKPKKKKG